MKTIERPTPATAIPLIPPCPSGRVGYLSEDKAAVAAKTVRLLSPERGDVGPVECERCGRWHLGRKEAS